MMQRSSARRRVFEQTSSQSRKTLPFQAFDVGLPVQSVVLYSDEWMRTVTITSDFSKHNDVDLVLDFYQYEYEFVFRFLTKHLKSSYWTFRCECLVVEYAVFKFLEELMTL